MRQRIPLLTASLIATALAVLPACGGPPAKPLPRVPMAVLSKTRPFAAPAGSTKALLADLERAWPEVQRTLVELGEQTPHLLATGSDHYVQLHDPDLTISAIRLVAGRIRFGR
ncbi:hypothetical protein ACIQWN_15440 [Streptomyces vinaceus]|uniref:hypothetical protein n=1 Tax=Streptomyces vinaceus TaxID=1960 RepID=UPI0037FF48B9